MAVQIRVPASVNLLANRINVGDTVEFVGKFNATQQALEQFSSEQADYAADLQAVADAVSGDAASALDSKEASAASAGSAAGSASAAAADASAASADRQAVAADRIVVEQASQTAVDSAGVVAIDRQVVEAAKADVTQLANYAGIRDVNKDLYGGATFFGDAGLVTVSGADYSVAAGDAVIGGIQVQIPGVVLSALDGDFIQCSVAWVSDGNGGYLPDVSLFADAVEAPVELNGVYNATLASVGAGQAVTDQRQVLPHAEQSFQSVQQLLADLDQLQQSLISERAAMVGALVPFTGDVTPAGWIRAKGYTLIRADFPELWAFAQVSGNLIDQATKDSDPELYAGKYGTGDGVTTFTIPEVRAEFIRALDDGRGIDAGREIGVWSPDEIKEHSHTGGHNKQGSYWGGYGYSGANQYRADQQNPTGLTGGTETRPRSIAYPYCIKY